MLLPPGYVSDGQIYLKFLPLYEHGLDLMLWLRNEDPRNSYVTGWLFNEARSMRRSTGITHTTQQLRIRLRRLLQTVAPGAEATSEGRLAYLGLPNDFVEGAITELRSYSRKFSCPRH